MNAAATAPLTSVKDFVDGEYFAHVSASLAASTVDGYRKIWRMTGRYFEGRELDLRTCDCQAIMRQLCADNPHLRKTSLRHIKNFLSGVWAHALRMGLTDGNNPWRVVQIPQAPEPSETHAYTPEEIDSILKATPAPYDLVVLLAACTGLRKSEIRGLRWSDWDAESSTLSVNRAVWRGYEKTTKSKASKAPVPVVPVLYDRLNNLKPAQRNKLIFAGSTGKPLDLDNLARRVIAPACSVWRGWHAFRRGLATYLHAQGVDDKTIQAILRHENVSITQQCYVKTVPESVRKAMETVKFGG
jgi:integrase